MKKQQTTYIRGARGNTFSITTDHEMPINSDQFVKDAKVICELLIGGIPSGTYEEVVAFLRAYARNSNMYSYGDEFEKHFEKRLKKLKKKGA